jgi:hypothetical protein
MTSRPRRARRGRIVVVVTLYPTPLEIDRRMFTYRYISPTPVRIDGEVRERGDEFKSSQDLRGWTSAVVCIAEPSDEHVALADASAADIAAALRHRPAADRLALARHLDDDELMHEARTRGIVPDEREAPPAPADMPTDALLAVLAGRGAPASDVLDLVGDDDLVAEVRDRGRDVGLALEHPEIVESVGDVLANLSPEQAERAVAHAGLKLAGEVQVGAEPVVEYVSTEAPLAPGGNFREFAARILALTGGAVKARSRAELVADTCEWIVDQSGIDVGTDDGTDEPSP